MIVSIGKHSRVGVYWAIGLKLVHQFYHVLVMLVVARILGPSAFGVMALAWAMVAFAEQVTRLGLPRAVVQKQHLTSDQAHTAFTYCLVASVAMAALLVALAPLLARVFRVPDLKNVLPPLALLFPISAYYYIRIALLQREMRFRLFAVIGIVLDIVQSTTTLVLALLGYGVWALVVGKLLGNAVAAAALAVATGWMPKLNWRLSNIRPMFHYASFEFLRGQLRYIENYVSYWIIGYHMAPSALGLLDRAQSISRMPVLTFQNQIGAILFPSFSHLRADQARLRRAFVKSLTSAALLMAGPLVGLASVSGVLVPVVLGAKWEPMTTTLQILCGAAVFRVLASTSQSLNLATTGYKRQTIVGGISALATIGGCLAGLPWGIVGVSVGLLAAAVVNFVLSATVSLQVVGGGLRLIIACLTPVALGAALMAGTVWILGHTVLSEQNTLNLLLLIASGALVYVAWVLCVKHDGVRAIRQDILSDLLPLLDRIKPAVDEESR
jgi:O-antigen/teichoic acid export membrane protein